VTHLETSNAAMAEDLLAKTAIIEHYLMDSRPGMSNHSGQSTGHTSGHTATVLLSFLYCLVRFTQCVMCVFGWWCGG